MLLYTWIDGFLNNTDIYIHKFFNSSMFWLFINLSNVKADDRIVWCLLINWFREVLKLEQFIIKWNSSPSSFSHQLHLLCSLGIPLWHPISTGSYVRYVSFNQVIKKYLFLLISGIEVVKADLDDPESLKSALDGAYGVFGITLGTYDEEGSERETKQVGNIFPTPSPKP